MRYVLILNGFRHAEPVSFGAMRKIRRLRKSIILVSAREMVSIFAASELVEKVDH